MELGPGGSSRPEGPLRARWIVGHWSRQPGRRRVARTSDHSSGTEGPVTPTCLPTDRHGFPQRRHSQQFIQRNRAIRAKVSRRFTTSDTTLGRATDPPRQRRAASARADPGPSSEDGTAPPAPAWRRCTSTDLVPSVVGINRVARIGGDQRRYTPVRHRGPLPTLVSLLQRRPARSRRRFGRQTPLQRARRTRPPHRCGRDDPAQLGELARRLAAAHTPDQGGPLEARAIPGVSPPLKGPDIPVRPRVSKPAASARAAVVSESNDSHDTRDSQTLSMRARRPIDVPRYKPWRPVDARLWPDLGEDADAQVGAAWLNDAGWTGGVAHVGLHPV